MIQIINLFYFYLSLYLHKFVFIYLHSLNVTAGVYDRIPKKPGLFIGKSYHYDSN